MWTKSSVKKRKTAGYNLMCIFILNCCMLHFSPPTPIFLMVSHGWQIKSLPAQWTSSFVLLYSDKWKPETSVMLFIRRDDGEPVAHMLGSSAPAELKGAVLVVRCHLPISCLPLPAGLLLPALGWTGSLQAAPVASCHVKSPSLK